MKKVRSAFYSADDGAASLCRVRTVNSSQSVRHRAAKKIKKLVRKMQDIQVRFNLIDVPAAMRKAHRLFAKYMAQEVRAAQNGRYSLAEDTSGGNWSMANSHMDDANGFWRKGATLNQSWYIRSSHRRQEAQHQGAVEVA